MPPGTAVVGDWSNAILAVRERATIDWTQAGSNFERKAVTFRAEERIGFALARPDAFVEVTTGDAAE